MQPSTIILGLLAAVLLSAGLKFWRETVVVVLIWSVVEGAARKWIAPSLQAPLLQIKDVALIIAYIGCAFSVRFKLDDDITLKAVTALVGAQIIYCLFEILNPNIPSYLLGVYGAKSYLIYLPLAPIIPYIFSTRADIERFIFYVCIASIPVSLLAIYQFSAPSTSWVNQYVSHTAGETAEVSKFGTKSVHARTSSSFSNVGGLVTYLIAAVPLVASSLIRGTGTRIRTCLAAAALIFLIGAALTTGSRTTIAAFAVAMLLAVAVVGVRQLVSLRSALQIGGGGALIVVMALILFPSAADAFFHRAAFADSNIARLTILVTETLDTLPQTPLFGMGIGSNSNAAPSIVDNSFYWLPYLVETEPARVLQDLGAPGFFMIYLTKLLIAFFCLRCAFRSQSSIFIATHLACAGFLIPSIALFTINNPTGGLYYWALTGLVVAMYRIERLERGQAEATAPARQSTPPAA